MYRKVDWDPCTMFYLCSVCTGYKSSSETVINKIIIENATENFVQKRKLKEQKEQSNCNGVWGHEVFIDFGTFW